MVQSLLLPVLAGLLKKITASENLADWYEAQKELRVVIKSFLRNTYTESISKEYMDEAFYIKGQTFVKKGFLLQNSLWRSMREKSDKQVDLFMALYYFLCNKQLSSENAKEGLLRVYQNPKKVGDAVAEQLNNTSTFVQRIRFQSFFKVYKMLDEAKYAHESTGGILPTKVLLSGLREYLRGVFTNLKHTDTRERDPYTAWKTFSQSIDIALECEFEFMTIPRFSNGLEFSRTLFMLKSDKPVTKQRLYRERFRTGLVMMLERQNSTAEITTAIFSFLKKCNFTDKQVSMPLLWPRINDLTGKTTGMRKSELYAAVDKLLGEILE